MKILLTLLEDYIAPRFDLTTKVIITEAQQGVPPTSRTILLPGPSSDELCSLILKENITLVVCGGIEERHYQYLCWKKIEIIDRVIGSADCVLHSLINGDLQPGKVVREIQPSTPSKEKS
ncbi:MAG: hypothetical protein KKE17_09160 [Proteobacteria bacterium]|nr:hypothetical protein [Pseudomonadota bacterium]MBU1710157.1 hypothetical protein [Pseudomonadota bacterium]